MTTKSFSEFALSEPLIKALARVGHTKPTPIQEIGIAPILEGEDVVVLAETGSGKTCTFAIPLIESILKGQDDRREHFRYLVLSPTRELAQQTDDVFNQIASGFGIKTARLIGGESMEKQESMLAEMPTILIATPGRLIDLVRQEKVSLAHIEAVVFDEVDRLFDMGFKKDIDYILSQIPSTRQLIMLSATSNRDVVETAYRHGSHPLEVSLNTDNLVVENIEHSLAMVNSHEKMSFLVQMLRRDEDLYAIVFCNTQFQTHLVAEWLKLMDFKAKPISGRLTQNKRTELMKDFRSKNIKVLVCTDVAARGLDIEDISLVVNYDLPREAPNYIHRIGRTGRAGKSGRAVSLCAHEDCEYLDAIYRLVGKIQKIPLSDDDFAKHLCKKPFIDSKTLLPSKGADQRYSPKKHHNRREGSNMRKPQTDIPREKPERTPTKPFIATQAKKKDTRVFEYTHESQEIADHAALGYFQVNDASLLQHEILKKGWKKFLFFGPSQKTFRYTLKPIYKKLLTPFIQEIFDLGCFQLQPNVGFKSNNVKINISGKDQEGIGQDFVYSLETLVKIYTAKKTFLPKSTRFQIEINGKRPPRKEPTKSRKPNSSRQGRGAKQEEELLERVDKLKADILSTSQPQVLKFLDPSQRRIVHQYIGEDTRFTTRSLGEGHYKRIEIALV